jgi:hypothetical protein
MTTGQRKREGVVRLHVAAVGDGASASIRAEDPDAPPLLIDGGGQLAAVAIDSVRRLLGDAGGKHLTVVITHLHADHFNGITGYAARPDHTFRSVDLVQPRLPDSARAQDFLARYLALAIRLGDVSGVPDLDFAAIIARLASIRFHRRPVCTGDWFSGADEDFEVFWPPKTATTSMAKTVRDAVGAYDRLADRDQVLRALLAAVREAGIVDRYVEPDTTWGPNESRLHRAREWRGGGQRPADGDRDGPERDAEKTDLSLPYLHQPTQRGPQPAFDHSLRPDVGAAAQLFRNAANDMSLVFASDDRRFVAFGDVPPSIAAKVARAITAADCGCVRTPRVVLAPHHGSEGPLPPMGGHPELCVAQNGGYLHGKWHEKHRDCPALHCVTTKRGSVHQFLRYQAGDTFGGGR